MTDKAYQQWRDETFYGIGPLHGKTWWQRALYIIGFVLALPLVWIVWTLLGWAVIALVVLLLGAAFH
jgi:hypothetical protein